jgi:L-amino acid N-acyltransferase YncA
LAFGAQCVMGKSMIQQFKVRSALVDDADAIAQIYEPYVLESTATFETEPPDAEECRRRILEAQERNYPFLVVEGADGHPVAFGFAQRYGPRMGYRYSVETTTFVRRDSLGQGIGGLVVGALVEACEARGYRQAFAVIAESEPASVVVHARAGYRPVGTLTSAGWKHGRWLDVFIMQRKLGEGNDTLPE